MNNLLRRIEKLERSLIGDIIHLFMADGAVRTIEDRDIPRIMREVIEGELSPEAQAVINCISTDECGGMLDLARAIYLSPSETAEVQNVR
jgi:hypothetical protein